MHSTAVQTSVEYQALAVGRRGFSLLAEDQTAAVAGVTSRGVFIRTAGRWLLFVSFEPFRGPLTVTLAGAPGQLRRLEPGAAAEIRAGRLILPAAGLAIAAAPEAVWWHPPPEGQAAPPPVRLANLRRLLPPVMAGTGGAGLGGLLPALLDLPAPAPATQPAILPDVRRLRRALSAADGAAAAETSERLLGRGRGLTPAGDDLALGLLLALNRWPGSGRPGGDLAPLNRRVTGAAYRKTTTLSANLIECATQGQADERLVRVVDALLAGEPPGSAAVADLLAWGASSGVDALAGMAIALTADA